MRCDDLKAELKRRNLSAAGNKAALIERLVADDELKAQDESKIVFMVKTLMGSWYTIKVDDDATILDVRNALHDKTGAPVDKIRLTHMHGNTYTDLPNDLDVNSFGSNEVMLDMMIRLR